MTRSKLTNANGFRPVAALRLAAKHEGIEEIEGGGMDDGRVFLHAASGWQFGDGNDGDDVRRSVSVGDRDEVRRQVARLRREVLR